MSFAMLRRDAAAPRFPLACAYQSERTKHVTFNYKCPRCRATLTKGTQKNDIDVWACPNQDGVGMTLSEAWGHLQDDEVKAIWNAAKNGQPSSLKSPVLGTDMVRIEIVVDSDEEEGNRGPDAFQMELDVSVDEQFIWFDSGELERMPGDLPNPAMSDEERRHIDEIAQQFGESLMASYHEKENESLEGRLLTFVAAHERMKRVHEKLARMVEAITPGRSF
jgi:Zn-finger nucleic acid-binding protein